MKWGSFFAGILGGMILVGTFKYSYILLKIPPLVATALLAIMGWFLKRGYENYNEESQALKRVETTLITNLANNFRNEQFFETWRKSLEADTLYAVVFRPYVPLTNFDVITDGELFNALVKLNLDIEGLELDLKNFYKSYANGSKEMLFTDHVKEWQALNTNALKQAAAFEKNFQYAEKDILRTLAVLRCYFKKMSFSSFQIMRMLGKKVYPFSNSQLLEKEIQDLREEFIKSKKNKDDSK